MSYLLADEILPPEVQAVMENRIGDCEICQEACPWNKKHLEHPLETEMSACFQKKIRQWGDFFHLSNLNKLSQNGYKNMLGQLNTDIPYGVFKRNVSIALRNAQQSMQRARP